MGPDDQKETELSAYAKRERKIDDARFLAGVRDIVAYIAFLVLYTIVIQTAGIEMAFPMASKMRDEVLGDDFESILVVEDVWNYLDGHFVDTAFLDEGSGDGTVSETPSGRWGYILDVNRMIGAIQFEQTRVDVGGALPWNATPRSLPRVCGSASFLSRLPPPKGCTWWLEAAPCGPWLRLSGQRRAHAPRDRARGCEEGFAGGGGEGAVVLVSAHDRCPQPLSAAGACGKR